MVFCNTRHQTDFVVKNLKKNKLSAIAIHGGLSQNKRTKTLGLFNGAKAQVLVCTDVAARGLHIDDVSHVYNYEIPRDSKDYVHRIGRTARAGEEGQVINLICDMDYANFSKVLNDYGFNVKKLGKPQVQRVRVVRNDENRSGSRNSRGQRRPYGRSNNFGRSDNRGSYGSRGSNRNRSGSYGNSSRRPSGRSYGQSNDSTERSNRRSNDSRNDSRHSNRDKKRSFGKRSRKSNSSTSRNRSGNRRY